MRRVVICLLLLILFHGGSRIRGQDTERDVSGEARERFAVTDLADVDEDFAYQGEYVGTICDPMCPRRSRRVGLQVVALGDGAFDAVAYANGLPGCGWYGGHKTALSGNRHETSVSLGGTEFVSVLSGTEARLYSPGGCFLGSIPKINRVSPREGALAPTNALVLFDGTGTQHFRDGRIVDDGLLDVGTELIDTFQDFTLHVEFRLPYMPYARGQGRSNSGIYLQSRYEVQVLDSFGLEGEFNECGALYRTQQPDINMCYPPLSWQTYDITFRSPRFDKQGNKTENARISVCHNGVYVHCNREIPNKTGAGRKEAPGLLPIKFQDHRNPVRFRNIWIVDHSMSTVPDITEPQLTHLSRPRLRTHERGFVLGLLSGR